MTALHFHTGIKAEIERKDLVPLVQGTKSNGHSRNENELCKIWDTNMPSMHPMEKKGKYLHCCCVQKIAIHKIGMV